MSETNPPPEHEPVPPTEPQTDAPADTGAAAETTTTETQEPSDKDDPAAKRIGRLTARLAAQSARNLDLEQRLAALERGRTEAPAEVDPAVERMVQERADKLAAETRAAERVASFHEKGKAAFADWNDRCQALMEMGADPEFANLLVDTDDGPRVAAALVDEPETMERIAAIKSPTGRALALGKFAASLEAAAPAAPVRPVSRAPAPIRSTVGGARVAFNEYNATPEQLQAHYAKQAMDARRPR
jgi:hypothetical protein